MSHIFVTKDCNDIWILFRFIFLVLDTVHLFLENFLQHLFSTGDKITVTPARSSEESWCDLSSMCHVTPSKDLCSAKNEKLRKPLFSPCTPKGTSLLLYSVNALKDHKILIHFFFCGRLWSLLFLFLVAHYMDDRWAGGWFFLLMHLKLCQQQNAKNLP